MSSVVGAVRVGRRTGVAPSHEAVCCAAMPCKGPVPTPFAIGRTTDKRLTTARAMAASAGPAALWLHSGLDAANDSLFSSVLLLSAAKRGPDRTRASPSL